MAAIPSEIAEGHERLRLAAESAGLGTWDYRPEIGIFECDQRGRELMCLEHQPRASFDTFIDAIHPDDQAGVRRRFALALDPRSGQPCVAEFRCRAAGGADRWIAARGRAFFDDAGRPTRVIGTLDDVSQRKQAEEDRERLVGELSRIVQSSEIMMGILGHDLRNPLAAIVTGAELLLKQSGALPSEDRVRKNLQRIGSSARRMTRMIEQLLDFTRIRFAGGIPLHPESVDLATIAAQVIEELRQAHPAADIRLEHGGDTQGLWDPDRLIQMLSNLLGNAIEHGTPDREIRVRLEGRDPGAATIEVRNHGSIPEEIRSRIFDAFDSGHERQAGPQGLGLGLYVVKQIIVAHGGDIEARATSAEETAFLINLPRRPPLAGITARPETEREEREMAALERFAAPPPATAVTAQLFGAAPLPDRAPRDYWRLFERYSALLDLAIERQTYKGVNVGSAEELRAIAERLGALGAGAREIAELHARAIRKKTRTARAAQVQAMIAEGRMLAFQLMGHVLSYYRRRAVPEASREAAAPTSPGRA